MMVCVHMPPAPGPHFLREGWRVSEVTSRQVLPPSSERNSPPGSTPHQSTSSLDGRSGVMFQIRSSFKPRVSNFSGLARVHVRPSFRLNWSPGPNHADFVAAQTFPDRGSFTTCAVSCPGKNGPLTVHFRRRSSDRRRKAPFRVPTQSSTFI